MILINSVAYVILFASFIAILKMRNHIVQTYVYVVACCFMTGFMTYSICKLRRFSKLLAAEGIIASKHLLFVHITAFWIVSALEITSAVITTIL